MKINYWAIFPVVSMALGIFFAGRYYGEQRGIRLAVEVCVEKIEAERAVADSIIGVYDDFCQTIVPLFMNRLHYPQSDIDSAMSLLQCIREQNKIKSPPPETDEGE